MNERDRYRFTRARSASPLPTQTPLISRKITKLKNGPSPTSVMGYTFDFHDDKAEDEPFDCSLSTRKRASSVGNLERMNGPLVVHQSPSRLSAHSSSSYSRQVSRRGSFHQRPPVHNMPPLSPRYAGTYRDRNSAPLSPGEKSVSKVASNFRQRRLLLSNQRHRNDNIRGGGSVDTGRRKKLIDPGDSIDGNDLSLRGTKDSLEISLTSHLERERLDCSYSSNADQFRKQHRDFPIQAARSHVIPSDDDLDSMKDNASHYSDFQEECDDAITIDTVSSLNTMQTEDAFRTGSYHTSGFKAVAPSSSPRLKYRQSQELASMARKCPPDDVHPPMYVRSKVIISSVSKEYSNQDEAGRGESSPLLDSKNRSYTLSVDQSNQSKSSPNCMLEDTDIVSNKTRRHLLYDNDNDIPAVIPQTDTRPTPSPLHQNAPRGSSYNEERSATYLRRERLQKLRMARHNLKGRNMGSTLSYPLKQNKKKNVESTMSDRNESVLKLPKDGTEIVIFKKPPTPPKELDCVRRAEAKSRTIDQDEYDNDIETDLYKFAKEREEEDDRSVMTAKSLQSFQTLKTCFTVKPSTRDELQKAIATKQRRILLIHHALTCTHPHPVDANDDNYVPCPEVKHCHALGVLVRHVQTCTFNDPADGSLCEVPGCALYKKVWNHYRRCVLRTFTTKSERKTCRICGDVWRKYTFDLENSF